MSKVRPRVSLIVPVRGNETLLLQTVERAQASAGCAVEIIIVNNGYSGPVPEADPMLKILGFDEPGCGAARHAGIMEATAPVICLIDSHVRLGDKWAWHVSNWHRQKGGGRLVGNGRVGRLCADTFMPESDDIGYLGADLKWTDTSSNKRVLVGRWRADVAPGDELGCLMGAYYTFGRKWYSEIGQPLRLLKSWGGDEEILSLATWLSGGRCVSLPDQCVAWHHFGRPKDQIRYHRNEYDEVALNRAQLANLFPFSERERQHLATFLGWHKIPDRSGSEFVEFRELYKDRRKELEAYLSKWVLGWVDWRREARPQLKRPQPLKPNPVDVCDQCGAVNSFRAYSTDVELIRYVCRGCRRTAWRRRGISRLNYGSANFV